MSSPFHIITKQYGLMYKHQLMLYNAEIGFKCSPSSQPPQWMRHRVASGNTQYDRDGSYKNYGQTETRKAVFLDPRLPRAAT